jgi:hypothetical protein
MVTVAALAAGVAASGSAQAKPNFAGRWTTDPDPAAATAGRAAGGGAGGGRAAGAGGGAGRQAAGAASMGSGWGSTITITQDAARLSVEYAFFARGDMQAPLKFVYALDGSATKNTVMMGRGMQEQTSRVQDLGDKLAIVTSYTIPNPAGGGSPLTTDFTQVVSLESPTSLVVETTRAGILGGAASTTRTVYRKIG